MAAEWIETRKAKNEQKKNTENLDTARESLRKQIINSDGSSYWDALQPAFDEQCADMDKIGFRGHAYPQPNPFCPSQLSIRIDVHAKSDLTNSAFAILYYDAGADTIQVVGNIPRLTELPFYVYDGELRTVPPVVLQYMNPADCAAYILSALVDVVEKQAQSR